MCRANPLQYWGLSFQVANDFQGWGSKNMTKCSKYWTPFLLQVLILHFRKVRARNRVIDRIYSGRTKTFSHKFCTNPRIYLALQVNETVRRIFELLPLITSHLNITTRWLW